MVDSNSSSATCISTPSPIIPSKSISQNGSAVSPSKSFPGVVWLAVRAVGAAAGEANIAAVLVVAMGVPIIASRVEMEAVGEAAIDEPPPVELGGSGEAGDGNVAMVNQ